MCSRNSKKNQLQLSFPKSECLCNELPSICLNNSGWMINRLNLGLACFHLVSYWFTSNKNRGVGRSKCVDFLEKYDWVCGAIMVNLRFIGANNKSDNDYFMISIYSSKGTFHVDVKNACDFQTV